LTGGADRSSRLRRETNVEKQDQPKGCTYKWGILASSRHCSSVTEATLRCVKEDGGVVAARYLFWENSHWTDAGGCAAYRTQLLELRCIKLLVSLYPGMIRRVTRGGAV